MHYTFSMICALHQHTDDHRSLKTRCQPRCSWVRPCSPPVSCRTGRFSRTWTYMTTAKPHNDQRVKPAETFRVTGMSEDRWRPTAVKGLPQYSDSIQTSWRPAREASRDIQSAAHTVSPAGVKASGPETFLVPEAHMMGTIGGTRVMTGMYVLPGHHRFDYEMWTVCVEVQEEADATSRNDLFPLTAGFGSVVPPLSAMQSTPNVAAPWWPRTLTGTRAAPHPVVEKATETATYLPRIGV